MRENRGPWYLLTGLMIGLVFGLVYAWLVEPARYIDAQPLSLRSADKDRYRAMIALAFQANGNLGRARQRLALLNDSSPAQALAVQAQASDPAGREGKALAALADSYNPKPSAAASATPSPTALLPTRAPTGILSATPTLDPALAVRTATLPPTPTPTATPTVTPTPLATWTPRPTSRPSPTQGAPFAYKDRVKVCNANLPPLLQVEVLNSAGQPVAGVRIRVTWAPNGLDSFYTGLNPELGLGYADFLMTPKINYTVQAGENGEPAADFSTPDCLLSDGSAYFQGGWKVRFSQP